MPCYVVYREASTDQMQLVTEIACERLMQAIIERCITLRPMYLEGAQRCTGALFGFSRALIVRMLLAPTLAPAPEQRCRVGRRGEPQEQTSEQARMDLKALRDEKVCTIVVRQYPF